MTNAIEIKNAILVQIEYEFNNELDFFLHKFRKINMNICDFVI
jgi:hypothetical protein